MKRFLVHELRLLSRREKSARLVAFHPRATVLTGENDTGKSSVLKSIPWCLGAEPAKKNSEWQELDIAATLSFSVDDKTFTAVRHQNQLALLDSTGRVIVSTNSVTRRYGPALADLVDFELILTDRESEAIIPPPAFWLLPFYTDQDKGWKDSWCSFANLGQFKDFKSRVAEYHIGLRSNLYYRISADISRARSDMEQPKLQEKALLRAIDQVRTRLSKLSVDFDIERFQAEVAELVLVVGALADEEERYRRKVGDLSSQRTFYTHQLDIAHRTLRELTDDYRVAKEQPHEVECPTCGATYHNSVAERFEIALDAHECQRIVTDVQAKLGEIVSELDEHRVKMADAQQRHERVWQLLSAKREAITLQEVLRGEARGQALEALQAEVDGVRAALKRLEDHVAALKDELKGLDTKERREVFLERFWSTFHAFCVELRVPAPDAVRTFAPSLNQTGSDLPRLVLAHNFAVLTMAWATGTCAKAPVILDSPHQQDPDLINRKTVCEFIKAKMPSEGQLLLAVVDPCGVDFGGVIIELDRPRALLSRDEYETTGQVVSDLVDLMYAAAVGGDDGSG